MANGDKNANTITQGQLNLLEKSVSLTKNLTIGSEDRLKIEQLILDGQIKNNTELKKQVRTSSDVYRELEKQRKAKQEINDLSKSINKQLQEETKGLGVVNTLFGKKLPFLNNVNKLATEEIMLQHKKGNLNAKNLSSLQKNKFLVGAIGKSLKTQVLNPANLIAIAFDYSKQLTALTKNLGLTNNEAYELRGNLQEVANLSTSNAILAKDVTKAFAGINDRLGAAVTTLTEFPKLLEGVARLNKLMGLTAESAAEFGAAQIRSGKPTREIAKEVIGQTVAVEKQLGIRLNLRKVLEDTAKVTGQIRSQLGANLKLIGEAVATARAFGLELSQVAKIGSSLLQFESSIAAELKAELLTGKQLNLEKARLYALTGDYTNLVKEINAQGMDWNKWSGMNVLQQNAYAEALGLTSNEMSDALLKEKDLSKMAQEARAAGNEELAQQLEKRDAQQKFGDAVEKVKDAFIGLAGPLSIFIEGLANILEPISAAVAGFGKIGAILGMSNEKLTTQQKVWGGIATILGTIYAVSKAIQIVRGISLGLAITDNTMLSKRKLLESGSLTKNIGTMVARYIGAFSTNPISAVIGTVAALALAATVFGLGSKKTGDMFSPAQGGTGYGKRTLVAPEGTFALNNNDTVIAGTSLFKSDDVVSAGAGKMTMGSGLSKDDLVDAFSSANLNINNKMSVDMFARNDANNLISFGQITKPNLID